MKLTLFTPHRQYAPIECDSVRLPVADSVSGRFSGSYGIRKGHAKAIFSLSEGKITVSRGGSDVFSAVCQGGFAKVENDDVRIVAEGVKEL